MEQDADDDRPVTAEQDGDAAQLAKINNRCLVVCPGEEEQEAEALLRGDSTGVLPRVVARMSEYSDNATLEVYSPSSNYNMVFPRWDRLTINLDGPIEADPEIDRQIDLMLRQIQESYGRISDGPIDHSLLAEHELQRLLPQCQVENEDILGYDAESAMTPPPLHHGHDGHVFESEDLSVFPQSRETEQDYKYVTDIQVAHEWWLSHYIPEGTKMSRGWITTLEEAFRALDASVLCQFDPKWTTNHIAKKRSHRAKQNKRAPALWTGYTKCGTASCQRRYRFVVHKDQTATETGLIDVQLHVGGVHNHTQPQPEPEPDYQPFIDTMEIPASWWESHFVVGRRSLTPGWFREVAQRFKDHRPAGVFCSLSADTNKVYKRNLTWQGEAHCGGLPHCSRKYKFKLKGLSETGSLLLSVEAKGKHSHSKEHPVREPLSLSQKAECYERLRAGMKPAQLSVMLKEKKASTDSGRQDMEHGNFDGVPSAGICRRLNKEVLAEGDLDDDPYDDLAKACNALDKKYAGNDQQQKSVFMLSERPFKVAFSTPNMREALKKFASEQSPLIAYVDCTGGILNKVSWSNGKNYAYSLVVKEKGLAPIPVCEFISGSHYQHTIAEWLREFRVHNGGSPLPFKIWVSDMSRAITNAVLGSANNMPDIITYLKACKAAKETGTVSFRLVVWCYAHFLQANIRKLAELLPKTAAFKRVKKMCKHAMAFLARTDDLQTAMTFLTHLAFVCESEYHTAVVVGAVREIGLMLGSDVEVAVQEDCVLFEDDEFILAIVDETAPEQLPVEIPDDDREDFCSGSARTFRDSPFYTAFQSVIDEVRSAIAQEAVPAGKAANPWRVPGFMDYIGEKLLPFYPMWSMYVLRLLLPVQQNPLTNFAVELRFKLVKDQPHTRPNIGRPSRWLMGAAQSAERAILNFKYPDTPRVYRKSAHPTTHNILPDTGAVDGDAGQPQPEADRLPKSSGREKTRVTDLQGDTTPKTKGRDMGPNFLKTQLLSYLKQHARKRFESVLVRENVIQIDVAANELDSRAPASATRVGFVRMGNAKKCIKTQ